MFDTLTERLGATLARVTGKARLTEDNIQDTLREARMALLEADVALPVVKDFLDQVRVRALGQEVTASLSPGQVFVKILNDELTRLMGEHSDSLKLNVQPPAVVLLAGLQGSGKTTSAAKLARWLKHREKKKVMLVSTDIYRPAAIDQLHKLSIDADVSFFNSSPDQKPLDIAKTAVDAARKQFMDVLIIDTAGRLHVDGEMMEEIRELHQSVNPVETLFVVDAMTGQDAANMAQAFNAILPISGVILTKADGDARGGAALSVRAITGKPIKFMAVGETIDALDAFYPDRIAGRILGMGDMLSLIEEAEQKIDRKKAKKLAGKIRRGRRFDLEDFRDQIQQMNNMGGLAGMVDKMPGIGNMPNALQGNFNEKQFVQMEAIINSMTPGERRRPDSINGSRKKRVSMGSGTRIQDVNRLLKQHKQMQKMMKKLSSKGGMAKMMHGMGGMMQAQGRFPGN